MRCVSSHDLPGMTGCLFLGLADDAVLRAPIIVGVCKIAAILGPGAETTRHVPAITKALKEALRGQQVRKPKTKRDKWITKTFVWRKQVRIPTIE